MLLNVCALEMVIVVSWNNMNSMVLSLEKTVYTECIPAMKSKPVHMWVDLPWGESKRLSGGGDNAILPTGAVSGFQQMDALVTDRMVRAYWTHSTRSQWETADPLGSGSDPFDPCLEVTPICLGLDSSSGWDSGFWSREEKAGVNVRTKREQR